MNNSTIPDGQQFLQELAQLPPETYEFFFAMRADELGLGALLERNDLRLLYEVSFCAISCNLAFNRGDACGETTTGSNEAWRTRLELEFMAARDLFCSAAGWQNLDEAEKGRVTRNFLRVAVNNDEMAW